MYIYTYTLDSVPFHVGSIWNQNQLKDCEFSKMWNQLINHGQFFPNQTQPSRGGSGLSNFYSFLLQGTTIDYIFYQQTLGFFVIYHITPWHLFLGATSSSSTKLIIVVNVSKFLKWSLTFNYCFVLVSNLLNVFLWS